MSATVAVSAPATRVNIRLVFAGLMLVLLLAALNQTIVAMFLIGSALCGQGRSMTELIAFRRELLAEALADDGSERNPDVAALLHPLARELCGEPPVAATPATTVG